MALASFTAQLTFCILLMLTLLPPWARSAERLVPLCPPDVATCEVTIEAAYRYTMVFNQPAPVGESWVPVEAKPDGLYTRGQGADCEGPGRKLTEEEAASVITGDGNYRVTFAVNGSVPGPPIVVFKGQEIIINFRNMLENEALTLHLHGLHQRGTPWMDGAGKVSHCAIVAGETFTYRIKADPSGTYWYHAHLGSTFSMGLHGPLVVLHKSQKERNSERGDDPLPFFEAEYSLVIQDWMDVFSSEVNVIAGYGAASYGSKIGSGQCFTATFQPDAAICSLWPFYSAIINGKGRRYKEGTDEAIDPNLPLETFPVAKGKKYYFRVICSALTFPFSISIDNHPLHVVSADGNPIDSHVVDSLIVTSGERYDFWIDAQDPEGLGKYWIRADTLETQDLDGNPLRPNHVEAILHYEVSSSGDPESSRRECTALNPCTALNCPFRLMPDSYHTSCITLGGLRSPLKDETAWESDDVLDIFLDLQINPVHDVGIHPLINGVKNIFPPYPPQIFADVADKLFIPCDPPTSDQDLGCECTHVIKIPLGQTVQLILMSDAEMDSPRVNPHPMHVHGYTPQIVKMGFPSYDPETGAIARGTDDIHCLSPLCNDGARWNNASWANGSLPAAHGAHSPKKDTVIIPTGGYVVMRFKADNPGFWLLHCHIEYHGLDGMALLLQVGEAEDMVPAPGRMTRCGNFNLTEKEYRDAIRRGNSDQRHSDSAQDDVALVCPVQSVPDLVGKGFRIATLVLGLACIALTIALIAQHRKHSARRGYIPILYKSEDFSAEHSTSENLLNNYK